MTNGAPEVVLGVTGSIGAYKSGDIVRRLREAGYGVTCVLTESATRFIAPMTLQALSERRVYTSLFDTYESRIVHTSLAERSKLILVAPATANIISRLAGGLADDLLSCIMLATRAKIVVAPAMNVHMWQHPSVQRNVTLLKRLGYRFVGPDVGKLACGYEAIGHLADVDEILHVVEQLAPAPPASSSMAATFAPRSKGGPKKTPKSSKRAAKRHRKSKTRRRR